MKKNMPGRDEMLARLRKKLSERTSNRRDPDQFIPPKVEKEETKEYFLRVLPPLEAGDMTKNGPATIGSELWFYENGCHMFKKDRFECPRLHDQAECPICSLGFNLMGETDNKEQRSKIAKTYLARSYFAVNVYFLNSDKNPEDVRGKVMWFNMPKTLYSILDACINNDDPGDEQDPKPHGIFYHPYEGGYTLKLVVKNSGEWNSYLESKFLTNTFGPLFKDKNGAANDAAIQKVLDQRFELPSRFKTRNIEKIEEAVAKLQYGGNGGSSEEEKEKEDVEEITGIIKGGAKNIKQPQAKLGSEEEFETKKSLKESDGSLPEEDLTEEPVVKTVVKKTQQKVVGKPESKVAPVAPVATLDEGEDDLELSKLLNDLNDSE